MSGPGEGIAGHGGQPSGVQPPGGGAVQVREKIELFGVDVNIVGAPGSKMLTILNKVDGKLYLVELPDPVLKGLVQQATGIELPGAISGLNGSGG